MVNYLKEYRLDQDEEKNWNDLLEPTGAELEDEGFQQVYNSDALYVEFQRNWVYLSRNSEQELTKQDREVIARVTADDTLVQQDPYATE